MTSSNIFCLINRLNTLGEMNSSLNNSTAEIDRTQGYTIHVPVQYSYYTTTVLYMLPLVIVYCQINLIGGVMVSMLALSAVDRVFQPRTGQTKDYKVGTCCFSAKHAALWRKSKDWLARSQDNVSKWSDMSTRGLLFQ